MGVHKHFPQLAVGDQPEFQTIYLAFQDFIRIITLSG